MEKPAPTDIAIHPVIHKRWSPRSFTSQEVEREVLEKIFEAARWAPSSFNEQPWRFIAGLKGDETYSRIMECLVEFNKKWAHLAPVLVITAAKKTFTKNGKHNRVSHFDLGQSVAYITFQAYHQGLVMHQMAGLSLEKARDLFSIPEDFEPLTAFALGYQGRPSDLPPDLERSELAHRSRRPLKELVFRGRFGLPCFEE